MVRGVSTGSSARPVTVMLMRESLALGGVTSMVYVPLTAESESLRVTVSLCGSGPALPGMMKLLSWHDTPEATIHRYWFNPASATPRDCVYALSRLTCCWFTATAAIRVLAIMPITTSTSMTMMRMYPPSPAIRLRQRSRRLFTSALPRTFGESAPESSAPHLWLPDRDAPPP
jgi:hypothetical protein